MVVDAPLVEFITFGRSCISDEAYTCTLYKFTFSCMPGESYLRQLRSFLLCLCYVFHALINSIVC